MTMMICQECMVWEEEVAKRKKLITLNIMNYLVLRKVLLLMKSKRHSEKEPSKSIQIKEEILRNLRRFLLLMKSYLIQKKENFMINMEKRD